MVAVGGEVRTWATSGVVRAKPSGSLNTNASRLPPPSSYHLPVDSGKSSSRDLPLTGLLQSALSSVYNPWNTP